MALQLLLGPELHAEIGGLAAALAMLARRVVVIAVQRALAAAPEVQAEAAVDFVIGADALGLRKYPVAGRSFPDSSDLAGPEGARAVGVPDLPGWRGNIGIGAA